MRSKISHKLVFAVAGVTILIIGMLSYLLIKSQQRALIAQIESNAHQLSEVIKRSTKYDMLLNRREDVHRVIDTIGEQDGIEKVRIFNKEGRIIYSPDKAEVGAMVDKQAEACYACHAADQPLERLSIPQRTRIFSPDPNHHRNLGIISPIYNDPGCWLADCHAHQRSQKVLGVLDVSMSLEEVDRQMVANEKKILAFTVAAILAISAILWVFMQRLVVKPVQHLVEATHTVAAGDLSYQLEVKRNDEIGFLGHSFNEMTLKLAEAQRQIYHSDKLASLGRLAAGVAHEINNPLTGVLTYSSFLLKRVKNDEQMKEDLETIVRETKRCRDIVKGLLDFSRQIPSRKSNVDVKEVIKRSLTILDNQLSCKNITVEENIAESLPTIRADANQMQQILIDLLVNATDAIGDKGGTIFITGAVERSNGTQCAVITIRDTGCGIPADHLPTIFEPFFTTKGRRGTGLGLAVVWGIVEKHGGKITVDSLPGQGATFKLFLPISTSSPLFEGPEDYGESA